jgi:hypothetical protein
MLRNYSSTIVFHLPVANVLFFQEILNMVLASRAPYGLKFLCCTAHYILLSTAKHSSHEVHMNL